MLRRYKGKGAQKAKHKEARPNEPDQHQSNPTEREKKFRAQILGRET
jgi:hypothetical protein